MFAGLSNAKCYLDRTAVLDVPTEREGHQEIGTDSCDEGKVDQESLFLVEGLQRACRGGVAGWVVDMNGDRGYWIDCRDMA